MRNLKWFILGFMAAHIQRTIIYVKNNPNNKDVVEMKDSLTLARQSLALARDDLKTAWSENFGTQKEKN